LKRSEGKATRPAKLDNLLKELPPEPSATAARWEATCSLDDYIQQASNAIAQTKARLSIFQEAALADSFTAERFKMEASERLFCEAKFQLLEPKEGLLDLLDKQNWGSQRPSVSLRATLNQRWGNFYVDWRSPGRELLPSSEGRMQLVNTTGLKDDFLREYWYLRAGSGDQYRRATELLRFRKLPLRYSDGSDHPATRYVMYAIRCRFDAVINQVKQVMNVAAAPKMNFTQDDDAGLELALSNSRRSEQ
jgi:hypothetical protein